MFTDGVLAREATRGEYRYVHRPCVSEGGYSWRVQICSQTVC